MTPLIELASQGRAEDLIRELRVRSLYSLYFFAKVVLGYSKLTDYFHQKDMDLFVDRWSRGATKQLIEWSRAFYKTTCFTMAGSMWTVLPRSDQDTEYAIEKLQIPEEEWFRVTDLHDQDATQLLAFETASNAQIKVGQIRWHFESNDLFRRCFPEIAYTGSEYPWNNKCLKIRRAGYGQREEEGTFEAIGARVSIQSRHYKIVWEDDLIGEKGYKSEVVMLDTIGWHQRLHGCFVDATRQIRFVVGNRWGYTDLNSHIREHESEFQIYSRSALEWSPVTGKDEAVFPVDGEGQAAYTEEELRKIEGRMSRYDFSCQYLNRPEMPGDQEVSKDSLHIYDVKEDGKMWCRKCGVGWLLSQCLRYLHYDPYNAKDRRSKSCPCIALDATSPDKHVFLVDYYTVKGDYTKVYDQLFSMNDRWKPNYFTYEDVGHQNMTEHHIRTLEKIEAHSEKHRKFPRIIPVGHGGKAMEIRVRDYFFPVIEKKKFAVRENQREFFSQIDTFPNPVLTHDYDLLDTQAQGATVWRFPETFEEVEKRKDGDEYFKKLGTPYSQIEVRA